MSDSCPVPPPKFESRIPEAFLAGLTPVEQAMVKGLDVLTQMNEHQTREIAGVKRQTTLTNGRVTTLEITTNEHKGLLDRIRNASQTARWLGGVIVGLLLYFADKVISKMFFLFAALALVGCSHPAPPQYVKPSVIPVTNRVAQVREEIDATRKAVVVAQQSAAASDTAAVKAAALAASLAQRTAAAKTAEAQSLAADAAALQGQITQFRADLDRVKLSLTDAEAKAAKAEQAAHEAQDQIGLLDTQIAVQTAILNNTAEELAKQQKARKEAESERDAARLALAKLWTEVIIAGVVLLVLLGVTIYRKGFLFWL